MHVITHQIPTCKNPNRFQKSFNVNYFKETERLKGLQKAEAYLELKWATMMELICVFVNILSGLLFSQDVWRSSYKKIVLRVLRVDREILRVDKRVLRTDKITNREYYK